MKIEHIAIWTKDLEAMKTFYCHYFGGKANYKYHNKVKAFESYFITFESGARLELMKKPNLTDQVMNSYGFAHLAFSVDSKENVDALTETLKLAGYKTTPPRSTGDGYYESTVYDPEGNLIEITI